jgi:hypothetical protein
MKKGTKIIVSLMVSLLLIGFCTPLVSAGFYEKTIDILVVEDEEFRALPSLLKYWWYNVLYNLVFYKFKTYYGVEFCIRGTVEWDSNDNSYNLYYLLQEAIGETGYSFRMPYNGYWIDLLMVFTGQEDPLLMGLSPPDWYALIIEYWIDPGKVMVHELGHQFFLTHCNNPCAMNPESPVIGYFCNPCGIQVVENYPRFWRWVETTSLTISASSGGTTNPAPGTYTYNYGSSVTVTASAYPGYYFSYWNLDGATVYGNPITVTMDSDHTLTAYVQSSGDGGDNAGCPTLFVWNGSNYVDYGVIDIHNPTGEDVTREVLVKAEDVGISNRKVKFRLREGWEGLNFSESVIDQVKLYAVDIQGNRYLCPLIKATHSIEGNVLSQLLQSDDYKVQILLLETIDLTFIVPYQNVQGFTFTIEGCNYFKM